MLTSVLILFNINLALNCIPSLKPAAMFQDVLSQEKVVHSNPTHF